MLYFDRNTDKLWLQIGLSACLFIGPLLYAYLDTEINALKKLRKSWIVIAGVLILFILTVGILYPYRQRPDLWNQYYAFYIYWVWKISLILCTWLMRKKLVQLISAFRSLTLPDKWLLSIYIGNVLIGIAFFTSLRVTYIMGPLTFSILLYWLVFLWYYRKRADYISPVPSRSKYQDKKIAEAESNELQSRLEMFLTTDNPTANPQLKLIDVAAAIGTSSHKLSQLLNDNLNTSYNHLINSYRVKAAKQLIKTNSNLSLEGIASEVGFRSKSSFYEAFKKEVGKTPGAYKKSI